MPDEIQLGPILLLKPGLKSRPVAKCALELGDQEGRRLVGACFRRKVLEPPKCFAETCSTGLPNREFVDLARFLCRLTFDLSKGGIEVSILCEVEDIQSEEVVAENGIGLLEKFTG